MASLVIPEEYEAGYAKLISLEDSAIEKLIQALADAPMLLRPMDLVASLIKGLSGSIDDSDVHQILQTLISLYALVEHFDSNDDLAEEICIGIEGSDSDMMSLPAELRERFKQRLIRLLEIDSIRVASKANIVLHEYERVLCNARVLTDIRPIFGIDPEEPPKAAVIVHTLKISYHDAEGLKEFYVAMDSNEMDQLMGVLDRADSKSKSLKLVLDSAKLPYVDAE